MILGTRALFCLVFATCVTYVSEAGIPGGSRTAVAGNAHGIKGYQSSTSMITGEKSIVAVYFS
jgi:hypothetical protein